MQHHPERVDIRRRSDGPAFALLRCEVGWGADHQSDFRDAVVVAGHGREAEVEHFDTIAAEHDVAGFQVAMGDAPRVGLGQSAGDLRAQAGHVGDGEWTAAKPRLERLAFDQFHDEERRADIVERADVRMVQRRQRQRLASEAQTEGLSRHFDGDRTVEARVQSAEDLAHPPAAQVLVHTIVPEEAAGLQVGPVVLVGLNVLVTRRCMSQQRLDFEAQRGIVRAPLRQKRVPRFWGPCPRLVIQVLDPLPAVRCHAYPEAASL